MRTPSHFCTQYPNSAASTTAIPTAMMSVIADSFISHSYGTA
jgi:hypothetical protein